MRTPMTGALFHPLIATRTARPASTTTLMALFFAVLGGGCLDAGDPGNLVPRTVDEDPALPQIAVAGTLLHAEAFGDPNAPLVIVLHGGPGVDYRSLLPLQALAGDGYRVVFWDQRGAGLSQRHDADTYTLPLYLEDLRLVIEHYSTSPTQPLVFIGHSWGAMYATWFINQYGDYGGRVRGAILSEPGGFTKKQLDAFLDQYIGSIDLTGEQLNDGTWSRQFMSPADQARADYLAAVLSFRGAPSERHDAQHPTPFWRAGAVVSAKMLSLAQEQGFDWTTHLAAFQHKVMFLRGGLNTVATLAQQQALASSYTDAEIITMANVGHEMVWERPDEYLAHTREYFQQIGFAGVAP
jgi:proline iminopeptidase